MRGKLESIRTPKWPTLFLIVVFLLMTVLVVPADSAYVAQSESVAAVPNNNGARVTSGTDVYQVAGAASNKASLAQTSTRPKDDNNYFTEVMSIILLLGLGINTRMFWKLNARH